MGKRTVFSRNLFFLWAVVCASQCAFGNATNGAHAVKVFVGSLGPAGDAIYLRQKLILSLQKSHQIVVVDNPDSADLLVLGSAAIRIVGYYNSNPRIRYRNIASVPVYDARMEIELKDGQGRSHWSGKLKPRFWGSQHVSDNVVNQAAQHVVEVLHEKNAQKKRKD